MLPSYLRRLVLFITTSVGIPYPLEKSHLNIHS